MLSTRSSKRSKVLLIGAYWQSLQASGVKKKKSEVKQGSGSGSGSELTSQLE